MFWVSNSLLTDWIQLPEVQPEHLMVARQIKHMLTGHLNAEVNCCPPFPGKERHLLRAQLARITHASEICPKGLYEIDEETQEVKMAEEFTMPSTEELNNMENWGHQHPIILKVGRCSHVAPAHMTDEEKEEYLGKLGEEDKVEERFRALNEDVPIKGLETAWINKICGDTQ